MTSRLIQWTLDVHDADVMADFWSQALGYDRRRVGEDGSVSLLPPRGAPPEVPTLWLQNCAEGKDAKNRNHPDLRPIDGDVEAEVARLIELGARRVDVGQTGDEGFVVLADPEGNEFCVLDHETRDD
jgi:Glyoxalase-like domain